MTQQVKPNIIVILADDLGYSDIGCYGGHMDTPNLDRLAANGIRLTQFYNTARCSPARASLLTGLHPHQAGMAHLQGYYGPYTRQLSEQSVTIAEVLKETGYRTYMTGKWHVGQLQPHERGFDEAMQYVMQYYKKDNIKHNGDKMPQEQFGDDYFATDDMTDKAVKFLENHMQNTPDQPFFLYMPYTAPHFPLQAKPEDIAKYKGRFDRGWDELREEKWERMKALGVVHPSWQLSPKETSAASAWDDEPHKAWRLRAMEVYAALVDNMDQNIGKLIQWLEVTDQLDNTMIMFLSDNGGNGEFPEIKDPNILPGGPDYQVGNGHYGYGWANLSNTPFRMYKHYIHQGGIASPFIVHWPERLRSQAGAVRHAPAQLPDIMATIVNVTGAAYPEQYNGHQILPLEGHNMMPIFEKDAAIKDFLFWEHEGNCGVRFKNWKLVRFYKYPWELYDIEQDGIELTDLADEKPDMVQFLSAEYNKWAQRAQVLDREEYLKHDPKPNRRMEVVDIAQLKANMR